MVVRIYCDCDFAVGKEVTLPEAERHYYHSVRRNRGAVELFNRAGQQAAGQMRQNCFRIERVWMNKSPTYDLTVALALPERKVVDGLVSDLSELGVKTLLLFEGDRSQAGRSRLTIHKRWEKLAIESARQCGRGQPLELKLGGWNETRPILNQEGRWFLEERGDIPSPPKRPKFKKGIVVVGCEGGWSESERKEAKVLGFESVHFETPVLRVRTAALCGAFFAIGQLLPIKL